MSAAYFEEICEILEVIADNYEKPEEVLKKLRDYKEAPRTLEEMEIYIEGVCNALILRELNEERIFPGIEYGKLVEKLGNPLKEIFEKAPRKLILIGKVKDRMVGIHPFFRYFYDSLKEGFVYKDQHIFKELEINFINKPQSLGFDGVELYLPLTLFDEPWKFYLVLNQQDASSLSLNFKEDEIVTNYKIRDFGNSLSIEILKPEKQENLRVVMQLPELFSEIKKKATELAILVGSDYRPYVEVRQRREKLIEKLEEVQLENEDFYKKLVQTREVDEKIPSDMPLLKSDLREYKKLYEEALIELEYYIQEREEDIEKKRKKIMERLMKEQFLFSFLL
ncbi:MAG: hypothetical protein QXL86_00810 [Candidatus Aenigmatarchaeota archaeon]